MSSSFLFREKVVLCVGSGVDCLALDLDSEIYQPCDLGQAT